MVNRLSLPNMTIEMMEDSTNIQANEQTKMGTLALEFIHEAKSGAEPLKEDATVVRAV
jgi:hypothetical protein